MSSSKDKYKITKGEIVRILLLEIPYSIVNLDWLADVYSKVSFKFGEKLILVTT